MQFSQNVPQTIEQKFNILKCNLIRGTLKLFSRTLNNIFILFQHMCPNYLFRNRSKKYKKTTKFLYKYYTIRKAENSFF